MQLPQPFLQLLFALQPFADKRSFLRPLQEGLFRASLFIITQAGSLAAKQITDNYDRGFRRIRKLLRLRQTAGKAV